MVVGLKLGAIALDCRDPGPLADFYAGLMGVEVGFKSDAFAAVKVQGIWLSMHKVEDYRPPRWPDSEAPKQMHLDFAVDDVDEAEAWARSVGARRADPQPAPDRWRVMIDPAGHPFCLSPASNFP